MRRVLYAVSLAEVGLCFKSQGEDGDLPKIRDDYLSGLLRAVRRLPPTPATTTFPYISNRGFTGHRHNNTGTYDLGLIYMNARYYLPEVGRFISLDTLVPDPGNPQSRQ